MINLRTVEEIFYSLRFVQDAFIFLRTFEELEGFDFALRDAVNTVVLEPNEARTFVAAGVSSHLSLIVTEACRRDSISSEPETSTSSIAVSSVTTGSSSSSNSRASGGDRSNHTSSGSSGGPSSSNVATSGPSSSRSVRGGDVIADRESGVIVLDESLEVTPKVRRKGNSSAIDVHSTGEGVIDLTFS